MTRLLFVLAFAAAGLVPNPARGQDDGPPIVIKSPDQATTYRFASIKLHQLVWDKKSGQLLAHVVFEEVDETDGQGGEDAHDFRLPGVSFDEKKGLFFATSAHGEVIPVARIKKTLFLKSIEPLPNANVRIEHPRGNVSVVLEAISPNDPAMHAPAPAGGSTTDSQGNQLHPVDIHDILH